MIRAMRRARAYLQIAALILAPAQLPAISFTEIFFFGDSVADTGNIFTISTGAIPPSPPYFPGRFADGPLFVEYLADALGFPGASVRGPVILGPLFGETIIPGPGNNFAIGGAGTGTGGLLDAFGIPSGIGHQVDFFLGLQGGTVDGNALYLIAGGANDLRMASLSPDPAVRAALASVAAMNIRDAADRLALGGANTLVVLNSSDLGLTPEAAELNLAPQLTEVSLAYNASLETALGELAASRGINIIRYDLFSAFSALHSDTLLDGGALYGLTNATVPCFAGFAGSPGADCSVSLFADDLHPTTAVHAFLAADIAAAIPEPATFLLVAGALGAALLIRRRTPVN